MRWSCGSFVWFCTLCLTGVQLLRDGDVESLLRSLLVEPRTFLSQSCLSKGCDEVSLACIVEMQESKDWDWF